MALRIIANKRVEMTDDEFQFYQKIANSYPQGKDLFRDLFETDDEGMIVFLVPPTKEFSMEVVLFLQNLMVHQHMRKIYRDHESALDDVNKYRQAAETLQETVDKLSKEIEELKASSTKTQKNQK